MFRIAGLIALAASLGACTGPVHPACAPGTGSAMALFTLYLGEAIHGRPDLTTQEWQSFRDNTVTAALPDGYTILDANGAWMNPATHKTGMEATKVVIAALPDTPQSLAAINRIRSAYQAAFHQQSVGMTVQPACGAF
jgi:hypothetical protein